MEVDLSERQEVEMSKRTCALLVMGLLYGCGAGSLKDLQSTPTAKYEFDVPVSYQAAYARIAYAARDCFQSAGPAASWYVEGGLRADLNRGDVTISLTNFGKRYYGAILVTPKDQSTAHATVWTARSTLQPLGQEAERWANGNDLCQPLTDPSP